MPRLSSHCAPNLSRSSTERGMPPSELGKGYRTSLIGRLSNPTLRRTSKFAKTDRVAAALVISACVSTSYAKALISQLKDNTAQQTARDANAVISNHRLFTFTIAPDITDIKVWNHRSSVASRQSFTFTRKRFEHFRNAWTIPIVPNIRNIRREARQIDCLFPWIGIRLAHLQSFAAKL